MKPDSLDTASDQEQAAREDAIRRARKLEPVPDSFDGVHCEDCGDEIPLARLELGKFRCVRCQSIREMHTGYFKR